MIWIVYFLLFFLYFILRNIDENKAKVWYIISFTAILGIMSALRHPAVGNDTLAYYIQFANVNDEPYSTYFKALIDSFGQTTTSYNKDPGYKIFCKLFYYLSFGNFIIYQFYIALLLLIPIGILIKRYVINFSGYIIAYAFYISLFYSFLPNSATRQTIALALFLWSFIIYITFHKRITPIVLIIIAVTIHKSVLINIVPCLMLLIRNKNVIPPLCLLLSIVVLSLGPVLVIYLGELAMSDNYASYGETNYFQDNAKPIGFILQMIAIYIIAIRGRNDYNNFSLSYQYVCINFFVAIIFTPIILVDPSLQRLTAYFAIWGVCFIPNLVKGFEYSVHKDFIYIAILLITFSRPIIVGTGDYKFIWQHKEIHQRYDGEIINYEGITN